MKTTTQTIGLRGLEAVRVKIEIETCEAGFEIVGLSEAAARETRVRVRSTLGVANEKTDGVRVTVHLDEGVDATVDLAIVAGILAARRAKDLDALKDGEGFAWIGGLSLAGCVEPVRGMLSRLAAGGSIVIPHANLTNYCTSIPGLAAVHAVADVSDVVAWIEGDRVAVEPFLTIAERPSEDRPALPEALRAPIAAAIESRKSVLLVGPPGSGKTTVARTIRSMLPKLSGEAARTVTAIHQVAGIGPVGIVTEPPLRAPHHTVSVAGLFGGGSRPRPGEISLAHEGVLYLDEVTELRRSVLDYVFEIKKRDEVIIPRRMGANVGIVKFPARAMIVASANPCGCGRATCNCSRAALATYGRRLDEIKEKFDVVLEMPELSVADLVGVR